MTEERVTINLLKWLESNSWNIICYDFPQSGTGLLLHPNIGENGSTKNKGGIIPDILATRSSVALFFENKDRFVLSDFEKIKGVKALGSFSNSLCILLSEYNVTTILYGIGLPDIKRHIKKSLEYINGIDFILSTSEDGKVYVKYDEHGILP